MDYKEPIKIIGIPDYIIPEDRLLNIIRRVENILNVKVTYEKDKQSMADKTIGEMRVEAQMLLNILKKLKGRCNAK